MIRTVAIYAIPFLFAFLVSVMNHTPVGFILGLLPESRYVVLSGAEGTLWEGRFQDVRWKDERLGVVSWNFNGLKLLQGKVDFFITFDGLSVLDLEGEGNFGYGFSGTYAKNVIASTSINEIASRVDFLTMLPVSYQGRVDLTINQWVHSVPFCSTLLGSANWSNATIETPVGSVSAGSVLSDISCEDNMITVKGTQKSEEVSGEFAFALTPKQEYTFSVWLQPESEFPSSLRSQLVWLGESDDEGRYSYETKGRL